MWQSWSCVKGNFHSLIRKTKHESDGNGCYLWRLYDTERSSTPLTRRAYCRDVSQLRTGAVFTSPKRLSSFLHVS
jgi:hypothetical protein